MSLSCLSPDTCQELLQGKMVPLSFQPSSVVRIFISSASSDMATERETLLKAAYPEVQAFCQKHSLMFEVIDLRWGVCDIIDTDHMSTQLCLEEIESCQKLSVGPTFIGLLGDRYGHRPLPRLIEEKEFEALIAQLTGDPTATHLLTFWYWKDENAIPSVYVLQPITDHLPHCHPTANQAQHQENMEVWRSVERDLASALRLAAREAEKHGLISQEQRHRYDKSETEWEIEHALFRTQEIDLAASIFLREVEGLDKHLLGGTSMQLLDTEENGSLDNEAQQLLHSLKAKIANHYPQHLKVHTVPWNAHPGNLRYKGQTKYLRELCEQFITATNHQVLRSLRYRGKNSEEPEGLLQELSHHMMRCLENCRVFCGRQDLLDNILQSIRQNDDHVHTPLILYGPPGCGKTALMCKLSEQVRTLLGQETVVVIRQLGTSQLSSAIHSLLRDICFQVCLAFGLPPLPVQVTQACSDLILFFHNLLLTVSHFGVQSLVLFFDSVDQLIPADGAHRLYWLPKDCPSKVHIVVSTSTAEHGILETLQEAMPEPEAYFEVGPLSREEGGKMLEVLLASVRRKLSPAQQIVFQHSFLEGGHPLLFKLAFNEARRWASYTLPSALMIATTAQEAMHHLCGRLEKLHGTVLVTNMLGYIASSRNGLSDAEMKDILSLDDEVLSEIYQHGSPPCKTILRFPPLLWARLRRDIGECLAERQADGFALLGLAHREFTEVVQNRYLPAQDKTKRHLLLADFFRGTWSWGMKKSLKLPLLGKSLNADRKVAPQPLWFSDTVANRRKLSELPFHLLNAGRIEELKQDVLGNMNWITCKIIATGIQGIANDFAMCNEHINCPELRLMQETLLLLKPALDYIDGGVGVTVLELSSDHRVLVAGSQDGTMVVWIMEDIEVMHTLTGHSAEVRCVKVFGKGTSAVSAAMDYTLRIWNLVSGRQKFSIQDTHSGDQHLYQLHVDERNRIVYSASGAKVNAWHLETAEHIFQISGFGVYVRVFLANSKGFHRFMAEDLEHECVVHSAVFSPDNSIIVTCSQGESIQVWSLSEQGLLIDTLDGMGTPVTLLALCGHTLVSASHIAPYLKVWDLTYDRKHKTLAPVPDRTGCTAMSHDGNYVYFPQAGQRHQVIIWDSTKGAECDTLDTSAQVRCLEVAEQRKLLFAGLMSGTVLVFPLNSRQDVVCIPPPKSQKPINHMALNRQEEQLAIACDDLVLVLDVSPGEPCPVIDKPIYTFYTQIPAAVISSVAVLANYRVLYGMSSGDLFLYDCPHSKVFPLEMHRCKVTCLETSHGEQWALSGSEDSLQCLWDLELCQWEHEMCYYKQTSFLKGIQCACFSKDDKYLYTGSFDHSITVWDVLSGALLAVQFVYATASRIMPTADGFVATTRLGYIIRERFHCPQSISSQYNPLQNIKATCVVKSRKKEEANPREKHDRGKISRNQSRTNKLSQNCMIM
ncbi:unnamed protein product [Caretta caretta]